MTTYTTQGVCAKEINFDVQNGRLKNVRFHGGCPGNLQAISILLEDMPVGDVIGKFRGNICQNGTSCTDQLARALEKYQNNTSA
ncbi:MAG TPA: TIGR03905 family TSCPD domain-containing protein [Patescibacteria group bacterium]|nr:TIGR03905 family TSCPD domain-containing protein [Patescibacteria group bacterium]